MRLTRKVLVVLALGAAMVTLLASGASAHGQAPASKASASAAGHRFLWGAWIGRQFTGSRAPWSWDAVSDFEHRNAGGKHVNVVHWGVGVPWLHGFRYYRTLFDRVQQAGAVSLIDMGTGSASLRSLAHGAHASAISRWARQAKIWGYPILLRFDWEMNGRWFPWGTTPSNRNTPADFVAAWRRVHQIFRAAGATNVSWVWCPNVDPYHIFTNLASLYPGNAYVNWTCLDGYNDNAPWTTFSGLYASTYRQIMQFARSKPMLVGEVASTGHGGSKARWISDMFSDIRTRLRQIRGIAWWDSYGPPGHRDWPIESNRAASVAFSRGIDRMCRLLSATAQAQCLGDGATS